MQEILQSADMASPPITNDIGSNIRAEMGRRRINMSELARRTGIPRGTLWSQINDGVRVTVDNLVAVAQVLDVSVVDLLGEEKASA